ncbi:DUF1639 domain-containing protein [Cucumis melo var. makuwa]|uniref:Uncharacterized protein LOC103494136 n=2 Tax=Cucumis melo TaxID=3656 RepID=A0A1S3BXD4_CUCME|nr:uncharacterized protein LOC103494136 [Cucumis melo]KAA0058089.1 DUF1639 domain-containing protein [Cucumis melo var. makuwa]TYK28442.1 DUF1639 domain-containing protein [Cucumis melo var. makuwa]
MSIPPDRSNPLHNFSLPCLKWGSQRFLKCMKVSSNSNPSTLDHPSVHRQSKSYQFRARPINSKAMNFTKVTSPMNTNHSKQKPIHDRSSSIEIMREKIMLDIREESKRLKFSITDEGGEDESAAARPWNLRTRRAACKAPLDERNLELGSSSTKATMKKKKKNRTALIVSLSKEELEEDFAVLVGRLPRRPKKRPRAVQKQMDALFPGLLLTEITLDSYKVEDVPEA